MSFFDRVAENLVPIGVSLFAIAIAVRWLFPHHDNSKKKTSSSSSSSSSSSEPFTRFSLGKVDVARGAMTEVKLQDDAGSVLLLRDENGKLCATGAKCTHAGAPLSKGVFMNQRIK